MACDPVFAVSFLDDSKTSDELGWPEKTICSTAKLNGTEFIKTNGDIKTPLVFKASYEYFITMHGFRALMALEGTPCIVRKIDKGIIKTCSFCGHSLVSTCAHMNCIDCDRRYCAICWKNGLDCGCDNNLPELTHADVTEAINIVQ